MSERASRKLIQEAALFCQLRADYYIRYDLVPYPLFTNEKAVRLAQDSLSYVIRDGRPMSHDYAEAAAMLYNDELPPGWEHV